VALVVQAVRVLMHLSVQVLVELVVSVVLRVPEERAIPEA
jgi:hypothetical protein